MISTLRQLSDSLLEIEERKKICFLMTFNGGEIMLALKRVGSTDMHTMYVVNEKPIDPKDANEIEL